MADGTGSLVEGLGAELLNNTGIPISPWDIHGEIYGMNGHYLVIQIQNSKNYLNIVTLSIDCKNKH